MAEWVDKAGVDVDQSQDNLASVSNEAIQLSRKSWTAYVGMIVRLLVLLALAAAAMYWQSRYWSIIAMVIVIPLLLVGYQVWLLSSYKLYYDEAGVWVYSGVLPWKRGVSGVKWRDLDEAVFVNNFLSWMTNSYTVQLKHRFTKAIEISEPSMAQGKRVAILINQEQRKRLGYMD